MDSIYKIPQTRWSCAHCGASGWWIPSRHIGPPPTEKHDTMTGRVCTGARPFPLHNIPRGAK